MYVYIILRHNCCIKVLVHCDRSLTDWCLHKDSSRGLVHSLVNWKETVWKLSFKTSLLDCTSDCFQTYLNTLKFDLDRLWNFRIKATSHHSKTFDTLIENFDIGQVIKNHWIIPSWFEGSSIKRMEIWDKLSCEFQVTKLWVCESLNQPLLQFHVHKNNHKIMSSTITSTNINYSTIQM